VAVLEIFCAHDTNATTGVNNVIEINFTCGAIFFAGPGGGNGPARVQSLVVGGAGAVMGRELNGRDLNAIEDLCTAFTRMSEDEVVGLRADNVPRIGVRATCANEVGICASLGCADDRMWSMFGDSQAGSFLFSANMAPIYKYDC
jgi:hypothetical protein